MKGENKVIVKLTTPPMGTKAPQQSSFITYLQNLLKEAGYYEGQIDGLYGPLTAQATYRAKFWLGYAKPDNVAGDQLTGLLSGHEKPTRIMVGIAAKRKADKARKASETPMRVKALQLLISKMGLTEHPANSNRCEISEWYGLIGPWCAMTGVWAYDHVGSKFFNRKTSHLHNWAYVPNIVHDARNAAHGLTITKSPQPGNGVCYDWPNESKGTADHYGTFEKWIEFGSSFYAIEGNTSVGNDSNGGELMRRERYVSTVLNFVVIGG